MVTEVVNYWKIDAHTYGKWIVTDDTIYMFSKTTVCIQTLLNIACKKFHIKKATWRKSYDACCKLGMALLSLETREEMLKMKEYNQNFSEYRKCCGNNTEVNIYS